MNKIAVATKYFGPVPVLKRLGRLRAAGLEFSLEVAGRYHLTEMPALKQEDFDITALHAPKPQFLEVCGSPVDGRESVRIEEFYAPLLEQAAAAGAARLVEHLGPARCARDRDPAALAGSAAVLVELGREFGVAVSFECQAGNAFSSAGDFNVFYANLPANAGYTLDVCHVLCCGETVSAVLTAVAGRLDHVHLMDVDFPAVPKQVSMGDWLPAGASESLNAPLAQIYASGFRGPWVIESESYYFTRAFIAICRKLEGLGLGPFVYRTPEELEDEVLKKGIRWLAGFLQDISSAKRS